MLREAAFRMLGKEKPPVGHDVELACRARCDGRRVARHRGDLGRETRGPPVVTASGRAVEDLDGHLEDTTRGHAGSGPPVRQTLHRTGAPRAPPPALDRKGIRPRLPSCRVGDLDPNVPRGARHLQTGMNREPVVVAFQLAPAVPVAEPTDVHGGSRRSAGDERDRATWAAPHFDGVVLMANVVEPGPGRRVEGAGRKCLQDRRARAFG